MLSSMKGTYTAFFNLLIFAHLDIFKEHKIMVINKDSKAYVVGLCHACPFGQELDECSLRHIRPKSLKERVETVLDMTPKMIETNIKKHTNYPVVRDLY